MNVWYSVTNYFEQFKTNHENICLEQVTYTLTPVHATTHTVEKVTVCGKQDISRLENTGQSTLEHDDVILYDIRISEVQYI